MNKQFKISFVIGVLFADTSDSEDVDDDSESGHESTSSDENVGDYDPFDRDSPQSPDPEGVDDPCIDSDISDIVSDMSEVNSEANDNTNDHDDDIGADR